MENYTKRIREILHYIYTTTRNYASSEYAITDEEYIKKSVLLSLSFSETQLFQNDIDYVVTLGIITMIRYQMYNDLYKHVNLKEKLGTANYKEKFFLDELRNHMSLTGRLEVSRDDNSTLAIDMLTETLDYNKKSVYDKILEIKALSKNDIKQLSENNPYFIEEIEKYDISITKEFIIDRINRLNSSVFKNNNEQTYKETADFILNLSKITDKEDTVLDDLVIEYSDSFLNENLDEEYTLITCGKKIYKSNLINVLKNITEKDSVKVKEKNIDNI